MVNHYQKLTSTSQGEKKSLVHLFRNDLPRQSISLANISTTSGSNLPASVFFLLEKMLYFL